MRPNRQGLDKAGRPLQIGVVSHRPQPVQPAAGHRFEGGDQPGRFFQRVQQQRQSIRQSRISPDPIPPQLTALPYRICELLGPACCGGALRTAAPLEQKPLIGWWDGLALFDAHTAVVRSSDQTYQQSFGHKQQTFTERFGPIRYSCR